MIRTTDFIVWSSRQTSLQPLSVSNYLLPNWGTISVPDFLNLLLGSISNYNIATDTARLHPHKVREHKTNNVTEGR